MRRGGYLVFEESLLLECYEAEIEVAEDIGFDFFVGWIINVTCCIVGSVNCGEETSIVGDDIDRFQGKIREK